MKKYTEHHCDGTSAEYWTDNYDGCSYGYACNKYSLQDAVRQFYMDIRLYLQEKKEGQNGTY